MIGVTLAYSPLSFVPDPKACRSPLSPLKHKPRCDHERHFSETMQRSRPGSLISNSPNRHHNKRASIYVSDASIILAQRAPIISPTSSCHSLLSPTPDVSGFVDHYAILELGPEATDNDITSAFRRLRSIYFQSDATKYKALTVAFDVLRDPEAREAYDISMEVNTTAPPSPSLSSLGDVLEQSKHERKDSAMGDQDAKMAVLREEEELEAMQSQVPNRALKNHQQQQYLPLIGTMPYQSYIPILAAYGATRRHPSSHCVRPRYTGYIAVNAMPV